jgi:multiple sugar transport system ATP-binding protein
VTRDQIEAMTLADRVVVMNGGRVEQIGAPLDLYDRPANLFVAGFIGSPSMNFITGHVTTDGFAAAGITLPLPAGNLPAKNAVYGIRPEHLSLTDAGLPATVLLVEPMGSETQVTLQLGEHQIIGIFRERVRTQPGQTIHVQPDLSLVHLFDTDTGQRLN